MPDKSRYSFKKHFLRTLLTLKDGEHPCEEDYSMMSKSTDPNGSYTGVPEDVYEKPIQDADDL